MRRFKPAITALVLVALLAVSGMSAMQAIEHRPGTRAEAERDELKAWLLSPAAIDDSPADKRQMARKAAAAFRQGFDWPQWLTGLGAAQRELLTRNFNELTRIWLLDRAEDWHGRPRNRRGQSLDREIDGLMNWRLLAANAAKPADSDSARLDQLRAAAEVCLAGETAKSRRHAVELLDAARGHILARGWMRWLPGSGQRN